MFSSQQAFSRIYRWCIHSLFKVHHNTAEFKSYITVKEQQNNNWKIVIKTLLQDYDKYKHCKLLFFNTLRVKNVWNYSKILACYHSYNEDTDQCHRKYQVSKGTEILLSCATHCTDSNVHSNLEKNNIPHFQKMIYPIPHKKNQDRRRYILLRKHDQRLKIC